MADTIKKKKEAMAIKLARKLWEIHKHEIQIAAIQSMIHGNKVKK